MTLDRRLRQIAVLVKKLSNSSRNIEVAGRLIDSFIINFNFEQMPKIQHLEYLDTLEELLEKYRRIRGR